MNANNTNPIKWIELGFLGIGLGLCVSCGALSASSPPESPVSSDEVAPNSQLTSEAPSPVEAPAETELDHESTVSTPEVSSSSDPLADFDMTLSAELTDTAKLLAGISVDDNSPLARLQTIPLWGNHSATAANAWTRLENEQLGKIRSWADSEIGSIDAASGTIFYPFSGPDFLYADTFFPDAQDYILLGLEPVGAVPNFAGDSDAQVATQIQAANQSLYAILQFSFFRTLDMQNDLAQQGVLPIIYVFMARTDNTILDVQPIGLTDDGSVREIGSDSSGEGLTPGVKISFLPSGETEPKTLYYFSVDVSDPGLASNPGFLAFVEQYPEPFSYLKAASYLMHYDTFTTMRDFVLSHSSVVLQDDSGIPLGAFEDDRWAMQFYGNYVRPINLFAEFYQADLRQAYLTESNAQPLNFGIGYKYYDDSHLMLGSVRNDVGAEPRASAEATTASISE